MGRSRSAVRAVLLASLEGGAACAGSGAPSFPTTGPADTCVVADTAGTSPAPLAFAIDADVDPRNAPNPGNDAEGLVFAQLYETLVTVDCSGRVRPGLAASWHKDGDGSTWVFALRHETRYWDGDPVDWSAIAQQWRNRAGEGDPEERAFWQLFDLANVRSDAEGQLRVPLRVPTSDGVRIFAHPLLAVSKPVPLGWPVGTGPYRVDRSDSVLRIRPHPADGRPNIQFRTAATGDLRDLLDAGTDALVTRRQTVVTYAAAREDLSLRPLAWDRTHVLFGRLDGADFDSAAAAVGADRAIVERIAEDAMRGYARATSGPHWWETPPCGPRNPAPLEPGAPTTPNPRIAFMRDDLDARDIAERLVALSAAGGRPEGRSGPLERWLASQGAGMQAVGMEETAFDAALEAGGEAGYVVALPSRVYDACASAAELAGRVPWVAGSPGLATTQPERSGLLFPLIDTRPVFVARQGSVSFYLTWTGTPVLFGAGVANNP